jgi:hypothetical protein
LRYRLPLPARTYYDLRSTIEAPPFSDTPVSVN